MKKYLKLDLAPFPFSLFTENGFRKNIKSHMFDQYSSTEVFPSTENVLHVVDGGFLLHKANWKKYDSIEVIAGKYLTFVCNHYADNSCIVFDGYPDNEVDNMNSCASPTKTAERLRRKNSTTTTSFNIEPQIQMMLVQKKFLSNQKNKIQLIKKLSAALKFEEYTTKQAEEDADSLIINSAIEIAEQNKVLNAATGVAEYKKIVVVVEQDINLLVLLNQLNSIQAPIYCLKPGAGNVSDTIYSSNSYKYEEYRSVAAFLSCFSGCDTTSAFAGKGKETTINPLIKTSELTE